MTTVKLAFDDLSPAEAIRLTELYAQMRMPRTNDIERTAHGIAAAETASPTPPLPPLPPRPQGSPAPAAAPSTGDTTATVTGPLAAAAGAMVDSRGVPWHPDFHSGSATEPGTNAKGEWKKRRNHDATKLKAYEAQFIGGKGNAAAGSTRAAPSVANTAASTANGANGQHASQADVGNGHAHTAVMHGAGATSPSAPPPPPRLQAPANGVPSMAQLQEFWATLCKNNRVTNDLQAWIYNTYGGNISDGVNNVFAFNETARKEVWETLQPWA